VNELVLIRGLPGSGKSTLARRMSKDGYVHLEADMFFEKDGVYCFEGTLLPDAHDWCQTQTLKSLNAGQNVVVANTFISLSELKPYLDMGFRTRIIEAKGQWKSIHMLPESTMQNMRDSWELLPTTCNIKESNTMKKYIVVTGAAGGMGRAITQLLLQNYGVIAIGNNMEKLNSYITEHQSDLITCEVDFSNHNWIDCMDSLLAEHELYGIVNLAGTSCGDQLEKMSDEDWAYSFAVNVTAPMQLTRWAAPLLKQQKSGSIVNVGSPVGILGARKSSYAASKAALIGLTMSSARELGQSHVRVNLLLPGPTITDMTSDWNEEKRSCIAKGSFLNRLCEPEEVAQMVKFLLSEQNSYMTGAVVDMTAGSMMGH